jgi:hypothetical protein
MNSMKHALTTRLFFAQLGLLVLIAAFHASALYFEWYWHVWQLDVPVHFTAGVWVCLAVYWLLRDGAGHTALGRSEYFFLGISVLYVGVGWEVFEIFAGIIGNSASDLLDSAKDICMDMLGASVGYLLISRGRLE